MGFSLHSINSKALKAVPLPHQARQAYHGQADRLLKVFVLVVLAAAMPLRAQLPLSERAKASMLTCGPGDDFYTSFGHSAIRISDPENGIDYVYNYGTFDFDTPNFYWKFMRGQLDYCLGRFTYMNFFFEYRNEGRAVWEQRLNLTPQEVCNLFLMLEQNYLPEYRYYRYDFFRDNCATRVRDMVYRACGKKEVVIPRGAEGRSYRDYLHVAMKDKLEWWALGVDLLLGLPADHRCTSDDAMFYPLVMQQEFAESTCDGQPLVEPSKLLLAETRGEVPDSFPPVIAFALLFALVVVVYTLKWRRLMHVLIRILFVVAGLIGLFLLFMWFGTDHYCTQWNLNILWASPMLLWIAIFMEKTPRGALWVQLGMFAVALVWVLWCHLSVGFVPIILTLALCVSLLLPNRKL